MVFRRRVEGTRKASPVQISNYTTCLLAANPVVVETEPFREYGTQMKECKTKRTHKSRTFVSHTLEEVADPVFLLSLLAIHEAL